MPNTNPETMQPEQPGSLLNEAFPTLLAAGAPATAAATAGFEAARGLAGAAETKGSIGQYLIAGGGAQNSEAAPMNAVVSALNRLAGLRSRL